MEDRLEVADVFRQYGQEFLNRWGDVLSPQQRKALRDIGACRTAALGTQIQQCDHCAHREIAYRSCRNRHCPKCHSRTRDEWLRDRAAELLPVPYCHVVFTLPRELAPLALQNQEVIYGILFRAVAESLTEMAADPKRLGARIGFLDRGWCLFYRGKVRGSKELAVKAQNRLLAEFKYDWNIMLNLDDDD